MNRHRHWPMTMRNEPDLKHLARLRGWYRAAIRGVPAPAPREPRLNGSVVLVILVVGVMLLGLCVQWGLRELGGP